MVKADNGQLIEDKFLYEQTAILTDIDSKIACLMLSIVDVQTFSL